MTHHLHEPIHEFEGHMKHSHYTPYTSYFTQNHERVHGDGVS